MAAPMRPGRVRWIGVRPAHRAAMTPLEAVELVVGKGLVGDRYKSHGAAKRQVTVIQAEDLLAIASYLGAAGVTPEELRRNLVVEGINLRALKGRPFRVGEALLEMTGECHPCSRMEEILGVGGYNAVRGHGGITARVLEGGLVRIGDEVRAD
jgi:MOSC domain-containing protein YiiM